MRYSLRDLYGYTRQQVCSHLERAGFLTSSGVEGMMLNDRPEPWLGLLRPISHNQDTRIFYWPDVAV